MPSPPTRRVSKKGYPEVIYYIEGKPIDDADWNRGLSKFSDRDRAEEHRKIIQDAFDRFCRWEMITRVVEVEGDILHPLAKSRL
jgi:hypothetical protein